MIVWRLGRPDEWLIGSIGNREDDGKEIKQMFGSTKVKLDKDVYEKVKKYAEIAGYSSVEEFVAHALEKELSQLEGAESEEEIKKRLQGLGYIS